MEAKFILIRHGQSLGNASNIYLGHTDLDLSELGKQQARTAAEYFKNEDICAIYTSDLIRAYNTALPHAELHSLTINASRNLREVHVGLWEGKPVTEIKEKWYNEFEIEWKGKFGSMTPPSGESVFSAGKRMYDELMKIAKSYDGKILVTSHAAVIRAFWCYAAGVEPCEWAKFVPFPGNASASFVGFDGEKLVPLRYSFDDYLNDNKTALPDA